MESSFGLLTRPSRLFLGILFDTGWYRQHFLVFAVVLWLGQKGDGVIAHSLSPSLASAGIFQAMCLLICAEMYQVSRLQHICELFIITQLQSMPSRELASMNLDIVDLLKKAKVIGPYVSGWLIFQKKNYKNYITSNIFVCFSRVALPLRTNEN